MGERGRKRAGGERGREEGGGKGLCTGVSPSATHHSQQQQQQQHWLASLWCLQNAVAFRYLDKELSK